MPLLIDAMERHGHSQLAPEVRCGLLAMSAATIDRALREVRGQAGGRTQRLPFPLLGFDTDNDSVFMNETVRDYCKEAGIEFTRCRPYRKNDQAPRAAPPPATS